MAVSKVEIANLIMDKLGQSRTIEAFDEDSPNARSINRVYNRTRDAELRRYDWGFAIKRVSIAADADQTITGEHNRYSLPSDYIRLVLDDESGQRVDWRIEGQYIVTDDGAPLEVRYIARIDDPNFYDALFIESLACKVSHQLCKEITGSGELKASLLDDYNTAIAEARRCGAIEKPAQDFPEDSWVNARL